MAIDEHAARRVIVLLQDLAPLTPTPTHEDMRQAVDALHAKIPVPPDIEVAEVGTDGGRALWICAPGTSRERIVIHFHGGAYVCNSPGNFREFGYRLSRAANARVLVPGYRRAPEHPYPAAFEDALAAYRWAARQFDPARIALTGNSAGCGLALALAVTLRDAGEPLPAALAFASAYIDLAAEGDSYESNAAYDAMTRPSLSVRDDIRSLGQLYLQGRDPKETPLASPLYADLSGLPPMYVAAGAHESLLDDSRRLVAKVRAAGGVAELEVAPDMQHDYLLFGCILPEARATFGRIGRFIQARTTVPGPLPSPESGEIAGV